MVRKRKTKKYATVQEMAAAQREISVAEFFAKNRHLLGFDNANKAHLTTVREAVDNALDACEEGGFLPELIIEITPVKSKNDGKQLLLEGADGAPKKAFGGAERLLVSVQDNGPGILAAQIPKIFGKLLYGSKFHRLKMARGQQGIGISAAGMYGLLTTGKSVHITSRTSPKKAAHHFQPGGRRVIGRVAAAAAEYAANAQVGGGARIDAVLLHLGHLADFLFQGHAGQQIFHPLSYGISGIAIDWWQRRVSGVAHVTRR